MILIYPTIIVFSFLTSLVIGDLMFKPETQAYIDLCSSCNGNVSIANNRFECNVRANANQETGCLTRWKRQARSRGLNLISCNSNTRNTRCLLRSKTRYNKNNIEQVAKYFERNGPMSGSMFLAPTRRMNDDMYVAEPSEIVLNVDKNDGDAVTEENNSKSDPCSNSDSVTEKPVTDPPPLKQEVPACEPTQTTERTTTVKTPEKPARASNCDCSNASKTEKPSTENPESIGSPQEMSIPDEGTTDNEDSTPQKCNCNCDNDPIVAAPSPFSDPAAFIDALGEKLGTMLGLRSPLKSGSQSKSVGDMVKAPANVLTTILERIGQLGRAESDCSKVGSPRASDSDDDLIVQPDLDDVTDDPIVSVTNALIAQLTEDPVESTTISGRNFDNTPDNINDDLKEKQKSPANSSTKTPPDCSANSPTDSNAKSSPDNTTKSPAGSSAKSPENSNAKSSPDNTTKSPAGNSVKSPEDSNAKSSVDSTTNSPADSSTKSPEDAKSLEDSTNSPVDSTTNSLIDITTNIPEDNSAKIPEDISAKSSENTSTNSPPVSSTQSPADNGTKSLEDSSTNNPVNSSTNSPLDNSTKGPIDNDSKSGTSTPCPSIKDPFAETETSETDPSNRTSNMADTKIVNPVVSVPTSTHIYLSPLPIYQSPIITRMSPYTGFASQLPLNPYFVGSPMGLPYYPNFNPDFPCAIRTARSDSDAKNTLDQQKKISDQQRNTFDQFIKSFIPLGMVRNIRSSKKLREQNIVDNESSITKEHEKTVEENEKLTEEIFKMEKTTQKPLIERLGYKSHIENLVKQQIEDQMAKDNYKKVIKSVTAKSKFIKPIKEIIKKSKELKRKNLEKKR